MKSMRTTLILGGWCGLLGAVTALGQVLTPVVVSNAPTTAVTAAVTNGPAPATAPLVTVTNSPAVTNDAPASVVSTGVTHEASVSNQVAIPAYPTLETLEAVPETTGYGFFAYQATGSMWKVGTRYLAASLKDTKRGTRLGPGEYVGSFMGSIMEIKEDDKSAPDRFFAQCRPLPIPVWIGVSRDHMRAKTVDGGGGDGSIEVVGWVPYVQAAWANRTRFTPYAEVGLALYQADFKENEWSDGGRRTVRVSDPQGVELAAGTAVRLWKHWSADFYVRQMTIDDVTGGYYIDGGKDGDVIFTLSYTAYGFGLMYEF